MGMVGRGSSLVAGPSVLLLSCIKIWLPRHHYPKHSTAPFPPLLPFTFKIDNLYLLLRYPANMAATHNFETCSNYSDCSSGCREIDPSHTHNAVIAAPVINNMEDSFRLMSLPDSSLPAGSLPLTRENLAMHDFNRPAHTTPPQAPADGGKEYAWYCCNCGYGPWDYYVHPGCSSCCNHNRCVRCNVVEK